MEKPKYILFKKLYIKPDVGITPLPLFKSIKDLAERIVRFQDNSYTNASSLRTFLSQALKANGEYGSKPLPTKLKSLILRIVRFDYGDEIGNELWESFDYWKTESNQMTQREFLDKLAPLITPGTTIVVVGSCPDFNTREDASYAFYHLLHEKLNQDDVSCIFYFRDKETLTDFWDIQVKYFKSLRFPYNNEYKTYLTLIEMTREKKINTRTINPVFCIFPLYCFFSKDSPNLFEAIFSISFGTNGSVDFIRYFDKDAMNIFKTMILPIIRRDPSEEEILNIEYFGVQRRDKES